MSIRNRKGLFLDYFYPGELFVYLTFVIWALIVILYSYFVELPFDAYALPGTVATSLIVVVLAELTINAKETDIGKGLTDQIEDHVRIDTDEEIDPALFKVVVFTLLFLLASIFLFGFYLGVGLYTIIYIKIFTNVSLPKSIAFALFIVFSSFVFQFFFYISLSRIGGILYSLVGGEIDLFILFT